MAQEPWKALYDAFYPAGTRARNILERHSISVASLAMEIARVHAPELDQSDVCTAAMLHDIGIFLTDAPAIDCHGCQPYLRHGILGADLLRRHGYPEFLARVAERHTGAGLTPSDAASFGIDAPGRVLMPSTVLEEIVCYADKFYSKSRDMSRKPLDRVRASLARFGDDTLARFDALHVRYSL